jgi:hypothetical protein
MIAVWSKKLGIISLAGQEALEDVKQRLEVDELGRVIDVELFQVAQDLLFDILTSFSSPQISSNQALRSARSRSLSTTRFSSMLGGG